MVQTKNTKRVVIKIGSSSLTSAQGELSRRKLEKLTNEIVRLKDEGFEVVIVSSGAVAAGYRKLGCLHRPTTLPERQAAASIGQGLLMETYAELFTSHGYVASQLLLTMNDLAEEERYHNVLNTLNMLLKRGIIPIINENDTVTIDELKFGDNDTLSAKVAALVDANQLIVLSDVDGLYDCDPSLYTNAKVIEQVDVISQEIEQLAGEASSKVGTGGMKSKLIAFKIAMAAGIKAFLGRATTENIIYDAAYENAKGTYFSPNDAFGSLDVHHKWIAFHSSPKGVLIIKDEYVSLIAEGKHAINRHHIKQVLGEFPKQSVVKLVDTSNVKIGLGLVSVASRMIEQHTSILNLTVVDPEQIVQYQHYPVLLK
ncbi:glutamate 5-kinase [Pontibacillus litoralis]|uniref:Glutamate 5-kinase n=1 Tax=Pontibacillus litoralis JSM 072002 TaxID=1385512 RepID=A0A0A5G1T9_9BACI|nr:glutamate 5-kinase [Pontibacillus litoralis]KGX87056.1 gamma-glutamyl kinase [Pontibacillus litoralis JSM 072002]